MNKSNLRGSSLCTKKDPSLKMENAKGRRLSFWREMITIVPQTHNYNLTSDPVRNVVEE